MRSAALDHIIIIIIIIVNFTIYHPGSGKGVHLSLILA